MVFRGGVLQQKDLVIADLPRLKDAEWHELGAMTARLGEGYRTGVPNLSEVPVSSVVALRLQRQGKGPTVYTTMGSEIFAKARK